jgi:hypothetical protein
MANLDFIANTILSDPLRAVQSELTSGGSVTADKVLFSSKTQVAQRTGLSYEEAQPEMLCRNSYTENASQDDSILINGTTYYLDERIPLQNGLTKWTLKLNPARTT